MTRMRAAGQKVVRVWAAKAQQMIATLKIYEKGTYSFRLVSGVTRVGMIRFEELG